MIFSNNQTHFRELEREHNSEMLRKPSSFFKMLFQTSVTGLQELFCRAVGVMLRQMKGGADAKEIGAEHEDCLSRNLCGRRNLCGIFERVSFFENRIGGAPRRRVRNCK